MAELGKNAPSCNVEKSLRKKFLDADSRADDLRNSMEKDISGKIFVKIRFSSFCMKLVTGKHTDKCCHS